MQHYSNLHTLTINLNLFFEEDKKDQIFEKIAQFNLKNTIRRFEAKNAMLNGRNVEAITKTRFLEDI